MQMNRNIGALTNRGIDINLVGRVLSTKDWSLDLTLSLIHIYMATVYGHPVSVTITVYSIYSGVTRTKEYSW